MSTFDIEHLFALAERLEAAIAAAYAAADAVTEACDDADAATDALTEAAARGAAFAAARVAADAERAALKYVSALQAELRWAIADVSASARAAHLRGWGE